MQYPRYQKQLVIIDISSEKSISGVDRYLEMLTKIVAQKLPDHKILRISLVHISSTLSLNVMRHKNNYAYLQFPFPREAQRVIDSLLWLSKYNQTLIHLLSDHLDWGAKTLVHIHTLNLMHLALSIKEQMRDCKIVSHLHCIPWKMNINSNEHLFNRLWYDYELGSKVNAETFLTNNAEGSVYTESDSIVCLTECAREFVQRMNTCAHKKISLIPNGLADFSQDFSRDYRFEEELRLIFVGSLSKGKGLDFILEAMCIAKARGAKLAIDVAGTCSDRMKKDIHRRYPNLAISLHGRIERDDLMELYRSADIGVIASLQEQCSYTAIEMAMMALPIITTAVDGLDEMFEDEVNALKVPVHFSRVRGLSVDVAQYAECLVRLTEDESLRARLGQSARQLYLSRYTLEQMGEATVALYRQLQESV